MSGGSSSGGAPPWRPAPRNVDGSKDGGSGSGSSGGSDPCNISAIFNLNSPNHGVLSSIKAGDTLNVNYQPGPPERLLAESPLGGIAGSITFPDMLQVIKCILHSQAVYTLDVLAVNGGMCRVRIHLQ